VILKDADYREFQRLARSRYMSLSAWVGQALAQAWCQEPVGDVDKKPAAVRAAAKHQGPPSPDIDVMLAEVERGYLSRWER
jgi:hypothetical protein